MTLKSVFLTLLLIFVALGLYEAYKNNKYFDKYFKEKKVKTVLEEEYYKKTNKMYFYYLAVLIVSFIYGILKKY